MNWETSFCVVGSIWALAYMYKSKRNWDMEKMVSAIEELEKAVKKLQANL